MALTNAEIQARFRERQKARIAQLPDRAWELVSPEAERFAAFIGEKALAINFTGSLAAAGVVLRLDLEEKDQRASVDNPAQWELENGRDLNSLSRAIVMVGAALDTARELSELINEFQHKVLDERVAEIEATPDLPDQIRKAALHDLEDIRRRLKKEVRYSFPAIEVRGD